MKLDYYGYLKLGHCLIPVELAERILPRLAK